MNILITGGFGHIGSYLLNSINGIKKIKKVYIIDNNSSNKINTIFNFKKKIILIIEDLLNKDSFKKINHKINIIIHLASITNVETSFLNKRKLFKNNYGAFINIVKFAKKNSSKLIHISSTSVYGSNEKIVNEKSNNLRPQSPYAEIKLKEENYLKKNKIKFVTLRFGTIAGISKGMNFYTAVNKFCLEAISNKPISIWKTAFNQYRPYLSIKDAIKAIHFVIEKNLFNNQIYNIVSENLTVKKIINKIKKNKSKITLRLINSKIMNKFSYRVLTNKIREKGLKLNQKIDDDIKATFKIFKNIKVL